MDKSKIDEEIHSLGLTVVAEFVPFSISRSKNCKYKSLNWRVTLLKSGHHVLTCDYSAGTAHCPANSKAFNFENGKPDAYSKLRAINSECETGLVAKEVLGSGFVCTSSIKIPAPDPTDVIYSLVMDAVVLDSGGFEDWCGEYGYDTDSRKAFETYEECLDHALKLRAGIGELALSTLNKAFADY